MQVIREIGKHDVYYLYLPAGYYLDKIILDPSDIVVDIFFSGDRLIYCFYNSTSHQSVKIVAHKELDDKKIARKLAVDPADIIWRQYFIRKAIVKPEIDYPDIMTQSQVADYLQYKLKTIQNWTSKGKIPYKRVGGDPRYSKKEIDEAIESGSIGKKKNK
jgi:excisionase family DNA binding protein